LIGITLNFYLLPFAASKNALKPIVLTLNKSLKNPPKSTNPKIPLNSTKTKYPPMSAKDLEYLPLSAKDLKYPLMFVKDLEYLLNHKN